MKCSFFHHEINYFNFVCSFYRKTTSYKIFNVYMYCYDISLIIKVFKNKSTIKNVPIDLNRIFEIDCIKRKGL